MFQSAFNTKIIFSLIHATWLINQCKGVKSLIKGTINSYALFTRFFFHFNAFIYYLFKRILWKYMSITKYHFRIDLTINDLIFMKYELNTYHNYVSEPNTYCDFFNCSLKKKERRKSGLWKKWIRKRKILNSNLAVHEINFHEHEWTFVIWRRVYALTTIGSELLCCPVGSLLLTSWTIFIVSSSSSTSIGISLNLGM